MRSRISILGVPFDPVSLDDALEKVFERLSAKSRKALFIATPNPEIILESRKHGDFFRILQTTDLNIADGIGVIFAAILNGTPLPGRVTGTDLLQEICKKSSRPLKIFLLGAAPGVAEKVKIQLETLNPLLDIVGTSSGSPSREEEVEIVKKINASAAELLFVAFGAPKQELWLARNLPRLSCVKVAMGVGGAFDFVAGVRKRAPRWMRKLALEWLYRLIQEPKRFKRIFNATIKFPIVFLLSKFHLNRP